MAVDVAVVDPLPLFTRGAVAALADAGHRVHVPPDVLIWAERAGPALIVITVDDEDGWATLTRLRAGSRHPVVVLLGRVSAATGIRAVRAGAHSVLPRDVSAAVLERTVAATIEGQAVLPAAVMAALAAMGTEGHAEVLSGHRLAWLRALAGGSTVAQLADGEGYSERAMFRMLRALYRDMGVRTRVEALIKAQEAGWL